MPHYIKKCPECGGINLNINKEKGEISCRSCGLIIEERMVDFGQEWREFEDKSNSRRRAGQALTYSVDYAEPVVIKEDGIIKIVKIGKFIDNIMAENISFIKKDGIIEYTPVTNIESVSFDKNHEIKFRKISEVSRHPAEEVYEVLLETGKRVKVTGNHSIFSVKNNEIASIRVDKLQPGNFIIAPKEIPLIENIKEINLLDQFIILGKKYPLLYLRNFSDDKLFNKLKVLEKENRISGSKIKSWKTCKIIPLWVLNELSRNINIYDYNINGCRIGFFSSNSTLPLRLEINNNIASLLGFFTAEGTVKEHGVVFSFGSHEVDYIEKVISIMSNTFDANYGVYNKSTSATQIEFRSKPLSILFKEILKTGSNAHTKRVPELIYSVPIELKKEYLTSYIHGDGGIVITEHSGFRPDVCVSTNSVSEDLTNDFILLYSQLGIHANYQEAFINGHIIQKTGQYIKESISKRALIKNPDTAFELGFLTNKPLKNLGKGAIENFIPAPQEYKKEWKYRKMIRIERKMALKIANKYSDEKLKKLVESPFLFLRVKSIKKVKSTSGYAYDFTVPGYENFVGGRGGIFLHNTKYDRGLGTSIGQTGDIYHLDTKERNKYFRLRKWQYRVSTAIERNLKLALSELKRVSSFLKLPKSVDEEAARIYTMAVQRGLVRGRSMESVVAGALYASCRRNEVPRTLDELSEASGIEKKEVGRTYRFITRELGIRILPSDPVDYLPRFVSALKLNANTQSRAVELLQNRNGTFRVLTKRANRNCSCCFVCCCFIKQ